MQHIGEKAMTFQGLFNIIWRKKIMGCLITVAATLMEVAVGSWLTQTTMVPRPRCWNHMKSPVSGMHCLLTPFP